MKNIGLIIFIAILVFLQPCYGRYRGPKKKDLLELDLSGGIGLPRGLTGQASLRIYRYVSIGVGAGYLPGINYVNIINSIFPLPPIESSATLPDSSTSVDQSTSLTSLTLTSVYYEFTVDFYPTANFMYFGFGAGYNEIELAAKAKTVFTTETPTTSYPQEIQDYLSENNLNEQEFTVNSKLTTTVRKIYVAPRVGLFWQINPYFYFGSELGVQFTWDQSTSIKLTSDTPSEELDQLLEEAGTTDEAEQIAAQYSGTLDNFDIIPYWTFVKIGFTF